MKKFEKDLIDSKDFTVYSLKGFFTRPKCDEVIAKFESDENDCLAGACLPRIFRAFTEPLLIIPDAAVILHS